jgi:cytochrome c-type biogenesis protein CcmH/NrfG
MNERRGHSRATSRVRIHGLLACTAILAVWGVYRAGQPNREYVPPTAAQIQQEEIARAERVSLEHNDYETWTHLAELYNVAAAPDRALEAFRRASECRPAAPEPHMAMADALVRLGRAEEARAEKDLAMKLWNEQESPGKATRTLYVPLATQAKE